MITQELLLTQDMYIKRICRPTACEQTETVVDHKQRDNTAFPTAMVKPHTYYIHIPNI